MYSNPHSQQSGGSMFFGHLNDPYFDVSCFPLGTMNAADLVNDDTKWQLYYYSPAICPSGWTTATTFRSYVPGVDDTKFFQLGPQTTAAICCPSSYSYFHMGHLCASIVTRDQRVPYVNPTSSGTDGWNRGIVSTLTVAKDFTAVGDGVQIRWQSSNEAVLAAATDVTSITSSSSSKKESQNSQQSPSLAPTASNTSDPGDKGGLSTGAKAGIGVSIAGLALLTGILVGILLLLRHKKRQRQRQRQRQLLHEVGGPKPVEKHAYGEPQEVPVRDEPTELYASPSQNYAGLR
ncbi:hypothetical protein BU23DRAFT_232606 [Bimuria novae-zelandiae CBS 107.79]|uniref:Uncharacterized protein n=1 Tax=Bimuria novae-zelandiae CBS 107.79 TaxID=1447943 RepID=A0A6A5UY70_9PLEO|nr:hypothetical protein BU23DRAFT_232606 [Bimuria novae-zelandiae CBS 107.79]